MNSYQELQHRFTKDKISTYTDMILGMPGETYDSFVGGIASVIENGQHNRIQFGNLSILPNAEMGDPEYQNKFGMEIIETEIINIHGSLLNNEEIYEHQQLVIATNSMPRESWIKTRAICWLSSFLHFDKVMQIPFIVLHCLGNISYRELIESFTGKRIEQFSILSEINEFFLKEALKIQNGGAEYCKSKKWLNIWWPADELQLIHLCTEDRLDQFYQEAEQLLILLMKEKSAESLSPILHEAIRLNRNLIKVPFQTKDLEIEFSYNIWEFYQNTLIGIDIPITKGKHSYRIDRTNEIWYSWEQWCKEVIWYGNKKGAYLYSIQHMDAEDYMQIITEKQIAGHH